MIFTLSAKPNEKAGESRVLPLGLLGGRAPYITIRLYSTSKQFEIKWKPDVIYPKQKRYS